MQLADQVGDDLDVRVLFAVMGGCRTVRAVGRAVGGLRSPTSAWPHLVRLRQLGLIGWDPNRSATIHPTVRRVK